VQTNSPAGNPGLYRDLGRDVMARLAVPAVASAITADQTLDRSHFHDVIKEYYDLEDIEP